MHTAIYGDVFMMDDRIWFPMRHSFKNNSVKRRKDMHRLYSNNDISVFWNSDKCFHSKKCVTGCPEAFDITRKPWINIDEALTAKVWKAVSNCPSGALTITYNHDVKISFESENSRSVAYLGTDQIGECDFDVSSDGWVIYHTEVDDEQTGKGIAKRLVYAILEQADKSRIPVSATCSYARKVMEKDS